MRGLLIYIGNATSKERNYGTEIIVGDRPILEKASSTSPLRVNTSGSPHNHLMVSPFDNINTCSNDILFVHQIGLAVVVSNHKASSYLRHCQEISHKAVMNPM
ncbi:MAG: hypothetical protein WCX28_04605 [Bacteriovoracaceae bacterium]|nr:hypothetical protein [Bacteroidota bacterium]